ncbi:DUF262 domain-containing protein [Oscillospiraceae bacterium OttesenSCG-928-G22]|nr:DUF262 domain-containing protein [Oscillospiraceae bacterium OttesenSCG-928-G22]
MKAVNTEFTKFLGTEAQYYVPIYQRKYSWRRDNCIKLLDDVIKVAKDRERPCHFIGSIIYLAKDDSQHASAAKEYLVIDGQQRLTTLSLLLLALADYTRSRITDDSDYSQSATNLEKISRKYLINEDEPGDMKYKVRLNDEDFLAYKSLLHNREKPEEIMRSKIFENYQSILNNMKERSTEPQLIFDGIKKLMLVDICLVPEDNAQLVFETVNSTGLPLATADKIRNFLLMTVAPSKQTQLYNDYWHPMERELGMDSGNTVEFEAFFNHYMTAILKRQLYGDYYEQFKDYYFSNTNADTEQIVIQIRQYSKYYKRWKNASNGIGAIDKLLSKIHQTGQLKITPVILKVLADIDTEMLSEDDALSILTIIEAYWMRRAICSLPANTAGPVCLSMLRSLDSQDKLKSFIKNIEGLTWAQRMPKDREIINTLQTLKLYSLNSSRTKQILDRLENNKRKEYVPTQEYTIEHIMPQTLSEDWKSDLGEEYAAIHETYLHTIGNLTLTGYNSEYQNKRFLDKLDCLDQDGNRIGYRHTPIRISSYLSQQSTWGKDQINERAEQLANELILIWKYPQSGYCK